MKFGVLALLCLHAFAADRPGTVFKLFQFPPDRIPRIDDTHKDRKPDPKDLDVKRKVSRSPDCTTTSSNWWWMGIYRAGR